MHSFYYHLKFIAMILALILATIQTVKKFSSSHRLIFNG